MVRRPTVLALVLLFIGVSLFAQTEVGVWAEHASSSTTGTPGGDIHFGSGSGYGFSLSRYWSHHLALELAASELRQGGTIEFSGQQALGLGRLKLRPISLAAQWHFAQGTSFDPYVGAGVAYITTSSLSSSDLDQSGIGTVEIKNGVAPLANAGVNFGIGHNLALAADFKYFRFRPDSGPPDARVRLGLNPLIASAGIRWRF